MFVILSILNDRNTVITIGGKCNSISFQKKLAQQQFRNLVEIHCYHALIVTVFAFHSILKCQL